MRHRVEKASALMSSSATGEETMSITTTSSSATVPPAPPEPTPHTKWRMAAVIGILGSLVIGVVVLAFLWPTKTAEPQNLPISVAGPAQSVTALESAIQTASPDTFDFVSATGRDDAVTQIQTRQTYGAIILGTPGQAPEVL